MYLHDKKPRISWTTDRISDILWIDKVLQHTMSTKILKYYINTHFECKLATW